MKAQTVTIEIATEIQTAVGERTSQGYDDMSPLIGYYTEYGYNQRDVENVVEDALAELAKVYGNN